MEATGGEPDVIAHDEKSGEFTFCDCSAESPAGRRSVCYDRAARDARKAHKPKTSAAEMADEMGIEMLTEAEYRALQKLGDSEQDIDRAERFYRANDRERLDMQKEDGDMRAGRDRTITVQHDWAEAGSEI